MLRFIEKTVRYARQEHVKTYAAFVASALLFVIMGAGAIHGWVDGSLESTDDSGAVGFFGILAMAAFYAIAYLVHAILPVLVISVFMFFISVPVLWRFADDIRGAVRAGCK